eukprot:CAMPEP_0115834556 /NCGR_PEP_ID=MMETSP0287-20121206/3743_1 /TAXON_ID=412157 /ORGANISM="Chrysochromulina rotalis, Strain UIO044" /LENGTH=219 /DNA_ID=CAMNT_0003287993 /DNA_START=21 /DNA_END=680 /DNA_ORIENTATION=+
MTRIVVLALSALAGTTAAGLESKHSLCKLNPESLTNPVVHMQQAYYEKLCSETVSDACARVPESNQDTCCNNDGWDSKTNAVCMYNGADEQPTQADADSKQQTTNVVPRSDQMAPSEIDHRFKLADRLEEIDDARALDISSTPVSPPAPPPALPPGAHEECDYPVNKQAPQQANCPMGYNCMRYIGPAPIRPDYCYPACESSTDCPTNQYCDKTWKVCY